MKICHIITTLVFGGAERVLVDLANIQIQSHSVDIIYLKGEPKFAEQLDSEINIHLAPLDLKCAATIRHLFKQLKPDIIHTHLGHADFGGLWASRDLPIKRFCTMHNVWFKWDWRDNLIFEGYRIFFNRLFPDTQIIGCMDSVSEHVHDRLDVPLSRVHTVRNSLPELRQPRHGRFELRESLSVPQDAFCVLFVGRLRIQKSVDTLLRAINELKSIIPNLLVLIVGEGQEYEEDNLKSLCTQLELDDVVQFRGVTKQPDKYMDMADIFVLPSVFEGLPLVMLEAFRSSMPVVATNIDGPKEVIVDGENGLLFQPKDYHALAEIIQLLSEDVELRAKLGVAGHKTYLDEFTIKKYADKIEKLYMSA